MFRAYALNVLCAQLTRYLLAIAKLLFLSRRRDSRQGIAFATLWVYNDAGLVRVWSDTAPRVRSGRVGLQKSPWFESGQV